MRLCGSLGKELARAVGEPFPGPYSDLHVPVSSRHHRAGPEVSSEDRTESEPIAGSSVPGLGIVADAQMRCSWYPGECVSPRLLQIPSN